jgi:glycosyltransferase involved in cell wall biosynthesis
LGDRLIIGNLMPLLAARGVAIDLLAFTPPDPNMTSAQAYERDKSLVGQYAAHYRSVTLLPEPTRTPLHYLRRLLPPQHFPRSANQAWSPDMWNAIENVLAKNQYDAVLLFGGVQVYEFAHLLRGQNVVITPYESFALYLQRVQSRTPSLTNWLRLQVARQYERFMFTPYKCVVVLAEADALALRQANPTLDVRVIPNGVRLPELTESSREAATLLFTGNFEYAPNVEAALTLAHDILPKVRQHFPDAKLWLVGNAPSPKLQALRSETIIVTGYVDDLAPYLTGATVFVSPLTLGAGLKNKILEAMAHGLPVVATPLSVDGIAAQHGTHALIGEIAQLADLTVQALQDKALQARLSANARSLVAQHYSWESVAERYVRVFGEGGAK